MSEPAGTNPLELRPARTDEAAAILAYYKAQLRAGARVADVMQWRAVDSAASGGNAPAVAVRDGALFGIVNSVPATLTFGGKRLPAAWQGDSVVSPELRGQGVARKLVHAASAEAAVVLAKGTLPAMYQLRKSVGFEDVGNAEYLMRGLGFAGTTTKRRLRNGLLWIWGALRGKTIGSAGIVVETDRFTDDFDDLESRIATVDEVRIAKSTAFLRWRYGAAPSRRYRIFRLDRDGMLQGAAVLRDAAKPGDDAWLVDLVVDPRAGDTIYQLVSAALHAARGSGAGSVRTFATSPRVREVLFGAGFVRTRDTPRFTRWIRDSAAAGFAREASWHISHGDGDIELY